MLATLKTLNKPAARAYATLFPSKPPASNISLVWKRKKPGALTDNTEYDARLISEISARKYGVPGVLVEGAWLWAILRHCLTDYRVSAVHRRQ